MKVYNEKKDDSVSKRDIAKSLFFIVITIAVAYWVTVRVGIDDVRSTVASAGIYAPLIIIVLKATTLVVVPLGVTPLYVIAGAVFGFWQGWLMTLVGDILGSAIAFYLSRKFGNAIIYFFVPKQYIPTVEKLVQKISEPGQFLRAKLFFMGFPELFAYAAGLTKVRFTWFILVHNGIHSIGAMLIIAFGGVLVSGHSLTAILIGVAASLIALAGLKWFHADITKGA